MPKGSRVAKGGSGSPGRKGCSACRRGRCIIDMTDCSYAVVRDVARALRWKVVREGLDEDGKPVGAGWDMRWSDLSVDPNRVLNMSSRQKTNHWPGMAVLCRKGDLARSLSAVASLAPAGTYDFVPPTWVLPADASLLQEHLAGVNKGER